MIFADLAKALKASQSCLHLMGAYALADGRKYGLMPSRLDEIRLALEPGRAMLATLARGPGKQPTLPRLNYLMQIRCPHERVVGLLYQVLLRLERLVQDFKKEDPALYDLINVEAIAREAFDELKTAQLATASQPAPANMISNTSIRPTPGGITVANAIDAYLEHLANRVKLRQFNGEAADTIKRQLVLFRDSFGNLRISEARQSNMQEFLDANPTWKSGHSKRRVAGCIVTCFRWCREQEIVERNPYAMPSSLRLYPAPPRRPATHAEYVALMRTANRAVRRMLFVLRRTGMRTCEGREMCWTHLHIDGDVFFVELPRHKLSYRDARPRKIGLDAATARFLRNLRRQAPQGSTHVLLNTEGQPWRRDTFNPALHRAVKRAGLEKDAGLRVTAYCFRHTYVVNAIESGIPSRQIADQLGHRDTKMIDTIYGIHSREHEEHLSDVNTKILNGRKRNGVPPPQTPPADPAGGTDAKEQSQYQANPDGNEPTKGGAS